MLINFKNVIQKNFQFSPSKNQLRDLERLCFEIIRRDKITLSKLIDYLKIDFGEKKYSGGNIFTPLRDSLIKRRFPLTSHKQKIEPSTIFSNTLKQPILDNSPIVKNFKPLKIFVEKAVKKSELLDNIVSKFPKVEVKEINHRSDYIKNNRFRLSDLKKPFIFIVKENWDFIKACPCTKEHLSCGYWVFNLSFGCPFDCSYCFLQTYANFPGVILPANLDDFFEKFDGFYKNIKLPIRIGTGEFCDSLALDELTGYSKKLVAYFKTKDVLFELKTKSNKIKNLLEIESAPNIVISWSLNPQSIISSEELHTASLDERLTAAKQIQDAGYKIAFHFDPIIHTDNWKKDYSQVLNKLYDKLKTPFAWMSLGTLRCFRQLKTAWEERFPQSNIFYGELFLGEDKKLRYPEFIRQEIYQYMLDEIKKYDTKTPVYLCMENKNMWDLLGKDFTKAEKIETYLITPNKPI